MPKTNNKKDATPFSLRLTRDERADLEQRAGEKPLGSYIRAHLFGSNETPRHARGRTPVKDHLALAQCLGKLGQSNLGSGLRDIANATRVGALPLSLETEEALHQAAADIAEIKRLLMRALGIRER